MSSTPTDCLSPAPAYGLLPGDAFRITTGITAGQYPDSDALPQALWYFSNETIAIPDHASNAGFNPQLTAQQDVLQWSRQNPPGTAYDYPTLVWLGAPEVIEHARLDPQGEHLLTPEGSIKFALVPRLESNRSFYDASSLAFFSQRKLRLRGQAANGQFTVRSIWPEDFRLDPAAPLKPLATNADALREFIRSEPQGGAQSPFATQAIWQRSPQAIAQRAGRPVIALILNGAQGDDDEAHGGHFALVTGRVGPRGEMHDWLVANYYTLDSKSEKGIIAAQLPLENYLADLNSGQSWYRPSTMLVATLHDERTATHLESALARVFKHFYRHDFTYRHAGANCAGICLSTLRTLGWRIPKIGAISWPQAIFGAPIVALGSASLAKGKAFFDYFSEEQTRLLPAIAFEQAGEDLLKLVSGKLARKLTSYEQLLREDIEEILLVRIPQLPSSRAGGTFPATSIEEIRRRIPQNPKQRQIIPVAARPFPKHLKDPDAAKEGPQRSDYAVAGYSAALLLLGGWLLCRQWKNRKTPTAGKAHHE